jgi:NhaA family Na+:H+ antiporter
VTSPSTHQHHPTHTTPEPPGSFFRFAVEHFLVVPLGVAIALLWVNADPESYYQLSIPLAFPINNIGMAFFFALITKEIVEATAPNGALHTWRRITLPIVAATGGIVVAAQIHIWFVSSVDEPMLTSAWGIVCATDIAVGYFIAKSIFRRHAAVPFLLLLSIVANAVGLVLLALFYPMRDPQIAVGIALLALAIWTTRILRRRRIMSFWPYVLVPGGLAWFALYLGGGHPAVALVPIMPFLPHAARDPGLFIEAPPGARDTLSRFDRWWTYPVQVVLLLFAVINGGVPLHGLEPGIWGLPLAMLIGKPVGTLAGIGLSLAAGLHLPRGMGWRELVVVSLLSTIGFTMALFFAAVLLPPGPLLTQAKLGALVSAGGAIVALAAAVGLRVGRFAR